jgi:hypothetical protein
MPAHYIAQANREKLGISGMEKILAFDQSQSLDGRNRKHDQLLRPVRRASKQEPCYEPLDADDHSISLPPMI